MGWMGFDDDCVCIFSLVDYSTVVAVLTCQCFEFYVFRIFLENKIKCFKPVVVGVDVFK